MDLSSIATVGGSLLSVATGGGIFGIFGGLLQKFLDAYQIKKQAEIDLAILKEKNAHELFLRDKDMEIMKLEAQHGLALAGLNAEREISVASYNALAGSYEADKATYATGDVVKNSKWFILVDFIRGMTRPVLTSYMALLFTVLTAYISWQVFNFSPDLLTDKVFIKQAFLALVEATIFMTTTVILWWFAARGLAPKFSR